MLDAMLDHNRRELIESARGLPEATVRLHLVPSLTTPISLIKHAAAADRIWFQRFWAGLDEVECDGYSRRDEGTFTVADDETLNDVIASSKAPAPAHGRSQHASASTTLNANPARAWSVCDGPS